MLKLFKRATLFVAATLLAFAQAEDITIFAAASLQNAVDEVNEVFIKQHPDVTILPAYDSSSNLARQINEGAPAQIFISANQNWMDYLQDNKKIDLESRANIVKNELALITNADNPAFEVTYESKEFWKELLKDTRLAVGDPDHVPVGMYAKASFEKLGVWDVVSPKVAAAQNVRAALLLVERNEANVGIVYSSDASISEKVQTVSTFPADLHDPIEYPIAMIGEQNSDMVKTYYAFLLSDDAKAIFKKYGFATP